MTREVDGTRVVDEVVKLRRALGREARKWRAQLHEELAKLVRYDHVERDRRLTIAERRIAALEEQLHELKGRP